jgi:predicted RNase H-like HicB family nuclease
VGGGGASATGSSVAEETQDFSYSTSVAGQQYWGSVDRSGGEYTASVPNLAGATAAGLSEQEAENNLNTRIDELV